MINGIGVDIVSLNRLKDNLDSIANKVLSLKEKEIYATLISERRKLEFVAGRFAFKEALFKAIKKNFDFSKVSLLVNEDGSPYFEDDKVHVSLSHDGDYVVAFVIVED